jgi:hypothetical protein
MARLGKHTVIRPLRSRRPVEDPPPANRSHTIEDVACGWMPFDHLAATHVSFRMHL